MILCFLKHEDDKEKLEFKDFIWGKKGEMSKLMNLSKLGEKTSFFFFFLLFRVFDRTIS
jgi:hypothetical protein